MLLKEIKVNQLSYFHDGSCLFPGAEVDHNILDDSDRPHILKKTENQH